MITEDYVSFETAKLLKEKGFPQEYDVFHSMVYNEEDYEDEYEVQRMVLETKLVKAGTLSSYPIGVPEPKCYCPTIQMAMKWLTKAHNIFISPQIEVSRNEEETGIHQYGQPGYYVIITYVLNGNTLPYQGSLYPTPEEACEVAIKYCLENLILKL